MDKGPFIIFRLRNITIGNASERRRRQGSAWFPSYSFFPTFGYAKSASGAVDRHWMISCCRFDSSSEHSRFIELCANSTLSGTVSQATNGDNVGIWWALLLWQAAVRAASQPPHRPTYPFTQFPCACDAVKEEEAQCEQQRCRCWGDDANCTTELCIRSSQAPIQALSAYQPEQAVVTLLSPIVLFASFQVTDAYPPPPFRNGIKKMPL